MLYVGLLGWVLIHVLALAAVVAVVCLARWLWRSTRRGVAALPGRFRALPGRLRALTVEPPPGAAFNDARDVWPMPVDD
ncbi:hypothetical protein [Micromonospora sp. AKA38]|uniref:hypothetical protein n=1 Tax=Micromonospora sp. AKA38 TaxID=2733861 RepID=UPI0022BCFE48|nr:hypothetical protein [Micromonospora sp. AKA38]GHJ14905.1 hypothetical protein TPA0908_29000 [Micromonospora sp. AKA38]